MKAKVRSVRKAVVRENALECPLRVRISRQRVGEDRSALPPGPEVVGGCWERRVRARIRHPVFGQLLEQTQHFIVLRPAAVSVRVCLYFGAPNEQLRLQN